MLNTDLVKHMDSDGATVNDKKILKRVKSITLTEKNLFHSLNVSNN